MSRQVPSGAGGAEEPLQGDVGAQRWHEDAVFAAEIAASAGRVLLDVRSALSSQPAQVLRQEGDRLAQAHLATALATHRPLDAALSEEAADDLHRLDAERVWIIDPLDGTREFSEAGREDWAVHVALWAGGDLVAGAVALPARGQVLSTADVRPPLAPVGARPRVLVSRSRPPSWTVELASRLGADLVPMGSAGAKVMAVVNGEADVYVHGGGQYEWDSAAPVAVARAAGLHCSRLDGGPLMYNRRDVRLPDLVVCRPEIAPVVLGAVRESGGVGQGT